MCSTVVNTWWAPANLSWDYHHLSRTQVWFQAHGWSLMRTECFRSSLPRSWWSIGLILILTPKDSGLLLSLGAAHMLWPSWVSLDSAWMVRNPTCTYLLTALSVLRHLQRMLVLVPYPESQIQSGWSTHPLPWSNSSSQHLGWTNE